MGSSGPQVHRTVLIPFRRVGKRGRQPAVVALTGCNSDSHFLHVVDRAGRRYLIDSGSEVSLIPASKPHSLPLDRPRLRAANGSKIDVYQANIPVDVDLGLGRVYTFKCIVAAVPSPILGADFLREFGIIVDMRNKRLTDSVTYLSTFRDHPATQPHPALAHVSTVREPNTDGAEFEYVRTSAEFLRLCAPLTGFPVINIPGVEHRIETKSAPVYARPRRLMPGKLTAAKRELNELLERGILFPSSSPWAAPYIQCRKMVEKLTAWWVVMSGSTL